MDTNRHPLDNSLNTALTKLLTKGQRCQFIGLNFKNSRTAWPS